MAYTKNVWVDQNVQRPKTYEMTYNADGSVTLTDSFGVVTEIGTPVNAVNMNHIEDGIKANDTAITTINSKIPSNASSSNKMVTQADLALKANLTDLDTKADKTQLHALKSYKDEGELLTDGEGLADVIKYAHSTFDRSKFTVVGSPNITNDGIASGFSNNNRLKIPNFPISNFKDKSWKIKDEFIMEGTSAGFWRTVLGVGSLYQSQWGLTFYNNTQEFNFYCRFGDTDESDTSQSSKIGHDLTSSTYGYLIGDTIQYELSFDISTGVYTLSVKRKDETNWHIKTYTPTTSNKQMYDIVANPSILLLIGGTTRDTYYNGSIDLKQFSITVDGVEVFSGNKTGLDTIKADDYSTVGSPVVTNGIATSLSSSNYFEYRSLAAIKDTNFWEIVSPVYTPTENNAGNDGVFQCVTGTSTNGFVIAFASDGYAKCILQASNFTDITRVTVAYTAGNQYQFKWVHPQTGVYECWYKINNGNWTLGQRVVGNSSTLDTTGHYLIFGKNGSKVIMDINPMTVKINGALEYQPCLYIPYYKSSTGSKIVPSVYRERVVSLYEQDGYAPYYTLDELNGNFTLPMGELYGYIEKCARDIAHPVAQPFYRFSDEINDDEVRLEGAEVDKGLYLAIEQNPYLSALCTAGSTSDKICLPDFRNRVIYGDVASGYVEPELPNITGAIGVGWGFRNSSILNAGDGALYNNYSAQSQNGYTYNGSETYSSDANVRLDASRSSSIYKNNGTVKTAGVKARWLCRWK